MAKTAKARADEARVNDTITRYNRMLVGDPPPDDNYTATVAYAQHLAAQDRAWCEGYRRQRAAHAARLRRFGVTE